MVKEYQCRLQTTSGYSFWRNGKAERRLRTLENTTKQIRGDVNLPSTLWYYSYEHAIYVYGAMIYSTTHESPYYQWYGIRRSTYDFRVWGCHIEAVHGTHLTNLIDGTESGYF